MGELIPNCLFCQNVSFSLSVIALACYLNPLPCFYKALCFTLWACPLFFVINPRPCAFFFQICMLMLDTSPLRVWGSYLILSVFLTHMMKGEGHLVVYKRTKEWRMLQDCKKYQRHQHQFHTQHWDRSQIFVKENDWQQASYKSHILMMNRSRFWI